jgi:uncharacterized membrane protein
MATMLVFIVLVARSSHLAPQLPRRDIFFGVTISPGFRDGPVGRSVSRRMGLGYTLNLGNPLSWLVMGVGVVALSIPLLLMP